LEDLVDACERCAAALHQVHHPSQRDHGPHQDAHVGVEHDEAAQRDPPGQHLAAAIPEHRQKGEADERLQQGLEDARDAHQPDILRDICAVQFFEVAQLGLFLHEGAHHAHAGQVLLHAATDIRKHGLDALKARVNGTPEEDHRQAHQGRRQDGQGCQTPIHNDHDDDGQQESKAGFGPIHNARAEHHADSVQVVGRARHDVAGAHAAVIIRRKLHQVTEQIVTQVVFDVARDPDDDHAHPVLKEALDGGEPHQQSSEAQKSAEAEGVRKRVDRRADHQRLHGARDIFQHQRSQAQRQPPAIAPQVNPDRAQRLPHNLHAQHVGEGLHPLDQEYLARLPTAPPAVGPEVLVGRGHHPHVEIGSGGAVDAGGARGMIVAGHQKKSMHAAAPQIQQNHGGFLARTQGFIGRPNEPVLRVAVLYGLWNRQVAFVIAVNRAGAAYQDIRYITLLDEFRGAHNAMAVIIAAQHYRDVRAGRSVVVHQQPA
jgi:hypothetical protein